MPGSLNSLIYATHHATVYAAVGPATTTTQGRMHPVQKVGIISSWLMHVAKDVSPMSVNYPL